jgi:hypothetical protein
LVFFAGRLHNCHQQAVWVTPTRRECLINFGEMIPFDIEQQLMDMARYKSVGVIDTLVRMNYCGIYCLRIRNAQQLPKPFSELLVQRGHNIVYIGVASRCLRSRFLNQELRAIGHGTFFRSIGAVLGFRPVDGSLAGKRNQRNYTFSERDKSKIIQWLNQNLEANWVEYEGDLDASETYLIGKYRPLINLAKNPDALPLLRYLRAECVRIAVG